MYKNIQKEIKKVIENSLKNKIAKEFKKLVEKETRQIEEIVAKKIVGNSGDEVATNEIAILVEKEIKMVVDKEITRIVESETKEIVEKNHKINKFQFKKALYFAIDKHHLQYRKSGLPYYTHCLGVAKILNEMGMDNDSIIAALLHDTIEDTLTSFKDIQKEFGNDVAILVDGLTKITKYKYPVKRSQKQADSFRKMLLSIINDIRVLIIKLADRLHNMRSIKFLAIEKQKRIAKETMEIYAPLAGKAGMSKIKAELEDLCFEVLEPEIFSEISEYILDTKIERETFISNVNGKINTLLKNHNIKCQVSGRSKHIWSVFKKMEVRKVPFNQIYDLLALRIITENVGDCYQVLGLIHSQFEPIRDRIKDYIANPKDNGYQSLHTVIKVENERKVEIQIRTEEMEKKASVGIAAHWRYKFTNEKESKDIKENVTWVREFLKNAHQSLAPNEFLNNLKSNLSLDIIYVFTRDDEILTLPKNSSVLDFAFEIHTDVGFHCISAKVNSVLVPLNYRLNTGDRISVYTSKDQTPKEDWLNYTVSIKAKTFIKNYLRNKVKFSAITNGKLILQDILSREKINKKDFDNFFIKQSISENEFYEDLGCGLISADEIIENFLGKKMLDKEINVSSFTKLENSLTKRKGIFIEFYKDEKITFGSCCQPIPGDQILGQKMLNNEIIIHRKDCSQIDDEKDQFMVEWDHSFNKFHQATLIIEGKSRADFLADIGSVFSKFSIEIISAEISKTSDTKLCAKFILKIENTLWLNSIIENLNKFEHITKIFRK